MIAEMILILSTFFQSNIDDSQVVRNMMERTVRVNNVDNTHGTGLIKIVDGKTYIITAAHVIIPMSKDASPTVTYFIHNNDEEVGSITSKAKILKYSEKEDIALLEVVTDIKFGKSVTLSSKKPSLLQRLYHCGNLLSGFSVSTGYTMNTDYVYEGIHYLQTSVTADNGSSGGGIFGNDTSCYGIVVRSKSSAINIVVPSTKIREWLIKESMDKLVEVK
jgi:hypothetical protein